MRIKFCTQQVNMSAQKMLELSRTVRKCREEAENVRYQLQQLTGLETCCSAVFRTEESMALLTARVAGLSSSLEEISELYSKAERRNANSLVESRHSIRETVQAGGTGSEPHGRIKNFNNK